MKKDIFEHNWVFRTEDGWLYGFQYKPSVKVSGVFLGVSFTFEPILGEMAKLIKETGKDYAFIPKNTLLHISDLAKREFVYENKLKELERAGNLE